MEVPRLYLKVRSLQKIFNWASLTMLPEQPVVLVISKLLIPANFTRLLTVREWQTRLHLTGSKLDPIATKASNNSRLLNIRLWRIVNWRWLCKNQIRGRSRSVDSNGLVYRADLTGITASCRIHTRATISTNSSLIKLLSHHQPDISSRQSPIFLSPTPQFPLDRSKPREILSSRI